MQYNIIGDHEIRAIYSEDTIRVYQAYGNQIADEIVKTGKFGKSFA